MFRVFYSWQSDRLNKTNRGLIEDALNKACKNVARAAEVEPVVERDTQGVPGAPNIGETILKKIREAGAFVADVSFIDDGEGQRRTPNPNVLIELGYALHALGHDRIVLVMNTHYGRPEELPFDLRQHRALTYCSAPGDQQRAPARKALEKDLERAIASIAQATPPAPSAPPAPPTLEAAEPDVLIEYVKSLGESNDVAGWRRLISSVPSIVSAHAQDWRQRCNEWAKGRVLRDELPGAFDDYLLPLQNILAVSVAGSELGKPPFNDLSSILLPVIQPRDWNGSGFSVIVGAPRSAGFVLHHLVGATALLCGGTSDAIGLAQVGVPERSTSGTAPLFLHHDLVMCPDALDGNFVEARRYLLGLPEKLPWLRVIFPSDSLFETCYAAYNLVLCVTELGTFLRENERASALIMQGPDGGDPDVYPLFALSDDTIRRQALQLAFPSSASTTEAAAALGVPPESLREHWAPWIRGWALRELQQRTPTLRMWARDDLYPGDLP